MTRLRDKLTYANVMVTALAFVVLGGSAYAATQLPADSVGTRQLKKGAVTPAKLSAAAKSTFAGPQGVPGSQGAPGATGATGPEGAKAADGQEGPRGADGGGAITIEQDVAGSPTPISFSGFQLEGSCTQGSATEIIFETATGTGLQVFGTANQFVEGAGEGVRQVDIAQPPEPVVPFGSRGQNGVVDVDVDVRNPSSDKAWTRIDVRLDAEDCILSGTAIPSTAG